MRRTVLPALFLVLLAFGLHARGDSAAAPRWWKGNTHTHTLWSDGDAAPEVAADWYRENGYNFLVLSDHNVLSVGQKWFPVSEDGSKRLSAAQVEGLIETFGARRVKLREREGKREMRLATLEDLRERFEQRGRFLFIQGEEITASFRDEATKRSFPVHVNGVNLTKLVRPQKGSSAREVMNACVSAVTEQGRRERRPVLAHVNHPNFGWGLTWEDVAHVRDDRFFEVYNGHRGVRNGGDETRPSTGKMWDLALTLRLTELDLGPLYGVATDDTHNYFGALTAQAGRGWVMVRAARLSADAVVEAMRRGDFYASSGVELEDFELDKKSYRVHVAAEEGVEYTTRFIGTRLVDDAAGEPGVVLLETQENPAVYTLRGDELYVRAVVVSSRDHPNPFAAGDKETAWLQPLVPKR